MFIIRGTGEKGSFQRVYYLGLVSISNCLLCGYGCVRPRERTSKQSEAGRNVRHSNFFSAGRGGPYEPAVPLAWISAVTRGGKGRGYPSAPIHVQRGRLTRSVCFSRSLRENELGVFFSHLASARHSHSGAQLPATQQVPRHLRSLPSHGGRTDAALPVLPLHSSFIPLAALDGAQTPLNSSARRGGRCL